VIENKVVAGIWWLGEKRIYTPTPMFFVSVASKGVSFSVSLLFATLAKRSICVAVKELMWTFRL
jgi:hypothetical protein